MDSLLLSIVLLFQFIFCYAGNIRPLVIWHGLGDSHSSPGMLEFRSLIEDIHPGIFVHSVYVEEELDKDRQAGFFGNVNEQVALVSEQLSGIPQLQDGFDAVGFSQGGQFLRAYVERFNNPPVNNLITFGSQHMGISDIPECRRYDLLCQAARRGIKRAVYSEWAQSRFVQAQYFRDPVQFSSYAEMSIFLADINNERSTFRNATYATNLASLTTLVLVMFSEDKTVVPKESSWFGSEAVLEETRSGGPFHFVKEQSQTLLRGVGLIPMRSQPLYLDDRIGLRQLDERGAVRFEICEGEHMQIGGCWERLLLAYSGGLLEGSP